MESNALKPRIQALAACVGLVWCVSLLGFSLLPWLPHQLALVPRRFDGLIGILGMPLVHGNVMHLVANTVPMIFFGALLLGRGARYFVLVTLALALLGGVALWIFGRQHAHIGASGVVFGMFGFLVVRGLYERRLTSIAVSVLVVFAYGGMIFGVLPQDGEISWDGHLCGLAAGVVLARIYARRNRVANAAREAP